MRLIESSDPSQAPRELALDLLHERLALADAVASALDACEGKYIDRTARAALDLLRAWIGEHHSQAAGQFPSLWDGLDAMTVPPGSEPVMTRLAYASAVAGALAKYYTADTTDESREDQNDISAALDSWRRARPADPTAWRRPVPGWPPLTLPRRSYLVVEGVANDVETIAEDKAGELSQALAEPTVGWPWHGETVYVSRMGQNNQSWELRWV